MIISVLYALKKVNYSGKAGMNGWNIMSICMGENKVTKNRFQMNNFVNTYQCKTCGFFAPRCSKFYFTNLKTTHIWHTHIYLTYVQGTKKTLFLNKKTNPKIILSYCLANQNINFFLCNILQMYVKSIISKIWISHCSGHYFDR